MPEADALRPYLERIDEARWYTNFGPLVGELETALAAHHRAPDDEIPHAVTVSNATLGLQLTLQALALAPGARVLVPGLTFPASVLAVMHAGLVPVVCDVDEASWLLTPAIARRALQEQTFDAVMPVSTFGCAQDSAAWDIFAGETGIPVVIDAAGAFGNQVAGRRVHTVISLHATKTLGAGEGGALLTYDGILARNVRQLSNFGFDVDTGYVTIPGTNAKLSEYHAAAALAALARWDTWAKIRIDLHLRYLRELELRRLPLRQQARPAQAVYSIFSVVLPVGRSGKDAEAFLASREIESRRWYCPIIPEHPAFHGCAANRSLDVSGMLCDRLIGLPFHPFLASHDVEKVISTMESYLAA